VVAGQETPRLPVCSALFKQRTGGLVVRWMTTSEYPLLYVDTLFFANSVADDWGFDALCCFFGYGACVLVARGHANREANQMQAVDRAMYRN
jgi:hypothetical protein